MRRWGIRSFLILWVVLSPWLCGCRTVQLEDRGFPLVLAIDKGQEGIILSYDFSDKESFSVEGEKYEQAQKAYENNTNQVLDYNHLKAIILSMDFLRDPQAMRELLGWLEGEEVVARNTCLFAAKDSGAEILTLKETLEESVGTYLEQMVETQKDYKDQKVVTIGDAMNQWHNRNELLLIPVLENQGGVPAITSYAALDAFSCRGRISVKAAMAAFLCQNQMESMTFETKQGQVFTLENLSVDLQIYPKTSTDSEVTVQVNLKGDARLRNTAKSRDQKREQLREQLNKQLKQNLSEMAVTLQEEMGIDLTNSYCGLGGYNRKLYFIFSEDREAYQKALDYRFQVKMHLLSE